jgi:CheY-like chemotaxis protein
VPKVLVADDNSNIQKMVALALKDQGIDVVAVGNGEAAVRKISDVHPDLVLADVFMPVRNGYEVCQYVKTDPALSHIPVILLVGAFDPLDEQEAQRVGADGVLKKPFVPPDPLISMVKSALQRAGVAHGNASSAKAAEPAGLRAADLLTPSAGVAKVSRAPVPDVSHEEPMAALENESFVDEIPARPGPVRIDSDSQPVAFGSLLETPAREEAEDDAAFMPPVHSELATERDWRDPDVEETDEEENRPLHGGTRKQKAMPMRSPAAGPRIGERVVSSRLQAERRGVGSRRRKSRSLLRQRLRQATA